MDIKTCPKYWFEDFKDGRTSQKWSPDTLKVVFLTEVDFRMDGRVSSLILLLNVVFQRERSKKSGVGPNLQKTCPCNWMGKFSENFVPFSIFCSFLKKWPLIYSCFSPTPYSCFSKIRKNTGTFVWNFGTFRNNRTLWVNTSVDTTILIKGLLDWLKGP